ncbi:hypothetical protein ACNUCX_11200 [Curtobacterium flaccumfaciens pv. flaccumfaciens]|uniref:DUF7507 domain-containing protein n=1 Tax=Curtobacterium flaccumfaciens TaxID=2035 RepID=UPI003AB715D0
MTALAIGGLSAVTLAAPRAAEAAPGNPGTPSAPTTVYTEDFQNVADITPIQRLTDYTGATGQKYTADQAWLQACNGWIAAYAQNPAAPAQIADCTGAGANAAAGQDAWNKSQQLAWAIGQANGLARPDYNFADTAFTAGNPGAGLVEFQTATNIPFTAANRFISFSADVAAINCNVAVPLLQFQLLNDAGTATNAGSQVNGCANGRAISVPAIGPSAPAGTVNVTNATSNGAVLFNGSSVGIRMVNNQGSGTGNDHTIDNIRILDVTPQLDKSFSPALVTTGGTSTLTFTVTNTSELGSKAGWSFTDALPAHLTVGAGTTGGTCDATTAATAGATSIAITAGTLNAGQTSCTITVPVTSTTAGSYTNGPDNITSSGLNPPAETTVTFEKPALSLTKRAGTPTDVNANTITDAGDTIKYTFDVTNSGDVAVNALAISDPKAGAVTCPVTTLAPGASTTCTADNPYTITAADANAGSADNTATATGTSPTGADVSSSPSSTTTPVTTAAPGLSIVKSVDPANADRYTPGQKVTYHFTVTNTGNLPMNDVTVNEGEFTGTGDLSAVDCPATTLAAGAQMVCDATYTLTSADVDSGSITNSATATGTPPGNNAPPITTPPSEITLPTPPQPSVSVVKSSDTKSITKAGQKMTYSFKVTNTGNVTLRDVTVTEGDFSGSGTLSDVVCPTTTLVAGADETCTATYTTTQADLDKGTAITNSATAGGTPPTGPGVTSDPSNVRVPVEQSPSMKVVKSASPTDEKSYTVGQVVTYSFVVTNTGNVTITDPTIDDSEFSGTGQLSPITCPAESATMAPAAVVTCTATYTLTQADVNAGKVTNTATVGGTTPDGDTTTSVPSTVTVPNTPHPALALVKTSDTAKITTVGQVVTYSFKITNTGNVTEKNVTAKEGKFTGSGKLSKPTCPAAAFSLAPGASVTCTATYHVTAADLASGTLSNTATATGTDPSGDPTGSDPSTANVKAIAPTAPAGLAFTGTELVGPGIGLALMLLALGGGLMVIRRRRDSGDVQDNA